MSPLRADFGNISITRKRWIFPVQCERSRKHWLWDCLIMPFNYADNWRWETEAFHLKQFTLIIIVSNIKSVVVSVYNNEDRRFQTNTRCRGGMWSKEKNIIILLRVHSFIFIFNIANSKCFWMTWLERKLYRVSKPPRAVCVRLLGDNGVNWSIRGSKCLFSHSLSYLCWEPDGAGWRSMLPHSALYSQQPAAGRPPVS